MSARRFNTPMIMYQHTPPHSNPQTFLSVAHTPRSWISVEALTVSQTNCPASIDDITSHMEDRPAKQI
jgi:hypothetical protein